MTSGFHHLFWRKKGGVRRLIGEEQELIAETESGVAEEGAPICWFFFYCLKNWGLIILLLSFIDPGETLCKKLEVGKSELHFSSMNPSQVLFKSVVPAQRAVTSV